MLFGFSKPLMLIKAQAGGSDATYGAHNGGGERDAVLILKAV